MLFFLKFSNAEMQSVILNFIFFVFIAKSKEQKKASQFFWDAFNTQMKPELRYSFRLG